MLTLYIVVEQVLRDGRVVEFVVFSFTLLFTLYYLWQAVQGRPTPLRELPQVAAISEGVDRAVETGQPIYVSPGDMAYLEGMYAPMTLAGMNVVRYTTRLAIQRGARVILPVPCNAGTLPLLDGIFREVAVAEGKPETYRRDDVIWFGPDQGHHSMGLTSIIAREGCACAIFNGACRGGGTNSPVGWAREYGGLVIGGTARLLHQGSWAMLSDYPCFMDDVYAMGAECSQDDVVKSAQVGGDVSKLIVLAMVIIFSVLAIALGQPVLDVLNL
jgi:hypothetical protein